jgi:hypothetical protein
LLNTMVFDKEKSLQAIDRVSSVTNVMRGVEFKTNTTNKAIESYESNTQTRLDEKIDSVEDAIGQVGAKIAHLCVRNMKTEDIAALLGDEHAAVWEAGKVEVAELNRFFNCETVGGSALKATSAQKKQQAAQLGQILGQFASATPAALVIALKVMAEAYDEIIITAEDWKFINDSIQQQLQKGSTSPNEGGEGAKKEGGQGGEEQGADALAQVEQIIDSLPDELKQELGKMIASGIPVREAIAEAVNLLQQMQQQQAA